MIRSLICFAAGVMLFFTCCDSGGLGVGPSGCRPTRMAVIFDQIDQIPLATDAARITEVNIRGDLLCVTVSYGGGCRDHEFELYAWSGFSKSNPPQAEVFLSHDANGDLCEAVVTEVLSFKLTPIEHAYRRLFGRNGPILLRIHEPGAADPISPMPLYVF